MKFTLVGLIVLLIVILSVSYYTNEEGFQTISNANTATLTIQPKQGSLSDLCYKPTDKSATIQVEQSACPPGSKYPYQITKLTSLNPTSEAHGVCSFTRQPNGTPDQIRWNATYMGDCNHEATYWKAVEQPSSTSVNAFAKAPTPTSPSKVEVTDTAYDAMTKNQRSQLLKDIQKIVRNEVLSDRSTTALLENSSEQKKKSADKKWMEEESDENCETTSTSQGKDYTKNTLKTSEDSELGCPAGKDGRCPPVPDMRDYIRKDKIPCWGCSIDY